MCISVRCHSECQFHNIQHNSYKQTHVGNELINLKNWNWIRKKKGKLKFAETPRGPWQKKRDDACVKEKSSSWQRGTGYLSLSGGDQRIGNIVADGCLGTMHTSLDVTLVSPFYPVAALSRSAVCWNIKEPQRNYKLTLTGLWQNFQKKTNPYGSLKYQMRTNTYMKRLTYFWHLNWRIQPFQCIQEKLPHPRNGCWTQ